jgi:hypothetical protein
MTIDEIIDKLRRLTRTYHATKEDSARAGSAAEIGRLIVELQNRGMNDVELKRIVNDINPQGSWFD